MISMKLGSARPGSASRLVLLAMAAAAVIALGACSAEPGTGSTGAGSNGTSGNSALVNLNPPSGRVSLTPTWATTGGCSTGYQGSAVFRIIQPSGQTFSISGATDAVTAKFQGTMLDPIGLIQDVAHVPNGTTAELVIICFSGESLTGTPQREMRTFVTFSANGFNYTTSATPPAGFTPAPAES